MRGVAGSSSPRKNGRLMTGRPFAEWDLKIEIRLLVVIENVKPGHRGDRDNAEDDHPCSQSESVSFCHSHN